VNQTQYVINSQPALSQVLVKTEASGTQTYYVYGLGLIGQETAGEYRSYHFDFRGSTVALTDESGQVLERFQYSPYGLLLSGDASKTPFLFNGMYGVMTDDNGLYYMRARFYSPEIRRFVNQDILLGRITEGQTLNRYAYVTGRPVSFVDPFGLDSLEVLDFLNGLIYGSEDSMVILGCPILSCAYKDNVMPYAELLRGESVREMISSLEPQIQQAAAMYGVSPDLIKAIIYEEQTHLLPFETCWEKYLGIGSTIGLGQITVNHLYTPNYTRELLLDPKIGIGAIAQHLSTLSLQGLVVPNSPIESIGTKYNCGSCSNLTYYGHRIGEYYDNFVSGRW
jgi:RHS repeat-associated protein